jgi:hypothetical protein
MSMGGPNYQSLIVPPIGGFGYNAAGRHSIGGLERLNETNTKPQAQDQMDIDEKVGSRVSKKVRFE